MSKYQTLSTIHKELKKINTQIDHKILKGVSYNREARVHKALLSQMSKIRSQSFRSGLGFLL